VSLLGPELAATAAQIDAALAAASFPRLVSPRCLSDEVAAYPANGGKRLRPALVLWTCQLFGGDRDTAMAAALSAELTHTWTLVHDDIIDGDRTRRGKPSSHAALEFHAAKSFDCSVEAAARYGLSFGLLTGDLQQAWVLSTLSAAVRQEKISASQFVAITERLAGKVYPELLSGEAIDVEFEYRDLDSIDEAEILSMLHGKTGSLLEFCVQTGALLGLGLDCYDDPRLKALGTWALKAGLAFQLRDDILGVYADSPDWGKPVGADIRSAKATLLIRRALDAASPADQGFLLDCLGNPSLTHEELDEVRLILKRSGALASTEELARRLCAEANEALCCLPDNSWRQLLFELAEYFIKRSH
jgi:geranylgeranyl pyrophosphate synthase